MRVPWSPPVDLVIRMTVTIPNPGLGKEEDGCKVCLLLAPPPLLEDSAFARSGGLSGQDTFRQVRSQASGVVGQVTSDTQIQIFLGLKIIKHLQTIYCYPSIHLSIFPEKERPSYGIHLFYGIIVFCPLRSSVLSLYRLLLCFKISS